MSAKYAMGAPRIVRTRDGVSGTELTLVFGDGVHALRCTLVDAGEDWVRVVSSESDERGRSSEYIVPWTGLKYVRVHS